MNALALCLIYSILVIGELNGNILYSEGLTGLIQKVVNRGDTR